MPGDQVEVFYIVRELKFEKETKEMYTLGAFTTMGSA